MLLKTSQVATLLNVAGRTVNRLTEAGELKAVKVGQQHRWPSEQFDELFDGDAAAAVHAEEERLAAVEMMA